MPLSPPSPYPLKQNETWNTGRRATNTGLKYSFNAHTQPSNPYMNTGISGRGVLGQFGPNHAVDNGVIIIKPDETGKQTIYALGILRKFDNDAPAFSGGFAKYNIDNNGKYIFDRDTIIETQSEEFFEEMISGSIDLLPEYEQQIEDSIQDEFNTRMQERNGQNISEQQKEEIREQVKTGLKLQQVRDKDPEFIERLYKVISQGHECFAGPVLNDNRNTNNAWIETRLSWFQMDDVIWSHIKGSNPVFNYQLSAGDDASMVIYHKIDENLIKKAYASHGPMFAFMSASYLLDMQNKNIDIDPAIHTQIRNMAMSIKRILTLAK